MKLQLKTFVLLALFIANVLMIGANFHKEFDPIEGPKLSLYGYKTVTTSEDNFKNLFHNLPKYIKGGESIDLLSYEYVGTINNKRQTKKYLKKNFKRFPHFNWVSSWNSPGSEEIEFESTIQIKRAPYDLTKSEIKEIINTVSEVYVGIGYEVFVINFVHELKMYSQYMFVNPETKKVELNSNIFGLLIPLTHFEHINNHNN